MYHLLNTVKSKVLMVNVLLSNKDAQVKIHKVSVLGLPKLSIKG